MRDLPRRVEAAHVLDGVWGGLARHLIERRGRRGGAGDSERTALQARIGRFTLSCGLPGPDEPTRAGARAGRQHCRFAAVFLWPFRAVVRKCLARRGVQRTGLRRIAAVAQHQRLREATDIRAVAPEHGAPFTLDVCRRTTACGAPLRGGRTCTDRFDASVLIDTHDTLRRSRYSSHRHGGGECNTLRSGATESSREVPVARGGWRGESAIKRTATNRVPLRPRIFPPWRVFVPRRRDTPRHILEADTDRQREPCGTTAPAACRRPSEIDHGIFRAPPQKPRTPLVLPARLCAAACDYSARVAGMVDAAGTAGERRAASTGD